MKKIFIILLTLFLSNETALAGSLCVQHEKVIFAFTTKSKKILSICMEPNQNYLTYRFGSSKHVELQFPKDLNESSWEKFYYFGMRRGGGKINAGFGDYSLSFQNEDTIYTVFQQWNDEEDTYSIGLTVLDKNKLFTISGLKQTQEGSLLFLDQKNNHLKNLAN